MMDAIPVRPGSAGCVGAAARIATWRGVTVAVVALVFSAAVAAGAAAAPAPERPARVAAVMYAAAQRAVPAAIEVKWADGTAGWWSFVTDFDSRSTAVHALSAGHQWRLAPDSLAQFALRVGTDLPSAAGDGSGVMPWVGAYLGHEWHFRRLTLSLSSGIEVPAGEPRYTRWETRAGIGVAW